MPAQVDSALLSHPLVTEAVSFGAPDEKYGESVAAAVVLLKFGDFIEIWRKTFQRQDCFKFRAHQRLALFVVTPEAFKGARHAGRDLRIYWVQSADHLAHQPIA